MSELKKVQKVQRIEKILEGKFQLPPRILIGLPHNVIKILNWPYQITKSVEKKQGSRKKPLKIQEIEDNQEFKFTGLNPIIIPSSESGSVKIAFIPNITSMEILDVDKRVKKDIVFNYTSTAILDYNPRRKHILVLRQIFGTGHQRFLAYDLEGKEVVSKVIITQISMIVIGDYIFFRGYGNPQLLLDSFTYEEIKGGINTGNQFYNSGWLSKEGPRLLSSSINETSVYDLNTRSKLPKSLISGIIAVVNSNYGIRSASNNRLSQYLDLVNLENVYTGKGWEMKKLPVSNFQASGPDDEHLLLVASSKILGNRILLYNITTEESQEIYKSNTKIDYAYSLEGKKSDLKVLLEILKRRLVKYLPLDLIKLTFSQIF